MKSYDDSVIGPLIKAFTISVCMQVVMAFVLFGCEKTAKPNSTDERLGAVNEANLVDTLFLKRKTFKKELVSNGKLTAVHYSDLNFKVSGQLKKLNVKNGSKVISEEAIAVLDQIDARQRLDQAEINLKKAKLNFDDLLLSRNLDPNENSKSSPVYERLSLSSGYTDALKLFETSTNEFENTILKAPFGGKIANLTVHQHELINAGNIFCTLIDDSEFEVEFYIIESEIDEVDLRDELIIIPFSQAKEFTGSVSEINPVVNENGLVAVKGIIKNNGSLWQGMNVNVLIRKHVPNQLVVPKSAVIVRQDQYVLFTYKDDKAQWTYVNIVGENSSDYSVIPDPKKEAKLGQGDIVITSGNLNLAHESDVKIK